MSNHFLTKRRLEELYDEYPVELVTRIYRCIRDLTLYSVWQHDRGFLDVFVTVLQMLGVSEKLVTSQVCNAWKKVCIQPKSWGGCVNIVNVSPEFVKIKGLHCNLFRFTTKLIVSEIHKLKLNSYYFPNLTDLEILQGDFSGLWLYEENDEPYRNKPVNNLPFTKLNRLILHNDFSLKRMCAPDLYHNLTELSCPWIQCYNLNVLVFPNLVNLTWCCGDIRNPLGVSLNEIQSFWILNCSKVRCLKLIGLIPEDINITKTFPNLSELSVYDKLFDSSRVISKLNETRLKSLKLCMSRTHNNWTPVLQSLAGCKSIESCYVTCWLDSLPQISDMSKDGLHLNVKSYHSLNDFILPTAAHISFINGCLRKLTAQEVVMSLHIFLDLISVSDSEDICIENLILLPSMSYGIHLLDKTKIDDLFGYKIGQIETIQHKLRKWKVKSINCHHYSCQRKLMEQLCPLFVAKTTCVLANLHFINQDFTLDQYIKFEDIENEVETQDDSLLTF